MRQLLLAFLCSTTAGYGSAILVTNPAQIPTSNQVLWSSYGPDQTGVSQTFFLDDNAITGRLDNGGGTILQAGTDWTASGGIKAKDALLSTSDGTSANGNGGLTFYMSPAYGMGAYIQAGDPGAFTARIQAFSGFSTVLDMSVSSDSLGDALFLGVADTSADITRIVYSLTSAALGDTGKFVLDSLWLPNQPYSVLAPPPPPPPPSGTQGAAPEPGTLSLLGLALLTLGFNLKRNTSRI